MRDANNNHIPDQVEDLAADAMGELREAGRRLNKTAEDARSEAVKGLHTAAENMRREARDRGISGDALRGIDETAHGLERAAGYLKGSTFETVGRDVERVVKSNPLPTLGIALVIGLIIGWLVSRK